MFNENLLYSTREKVLIELDKISKRIDEFSDYGELEMMKQYVDDVKSVQKRIAEVEKTIDWVRNVRFEIKLNFYIHIMLIVFETFKEEVQFKMQRSEYPQLDVIKVNLDPFSRLFNTVLKWQRSEKKWTDGSFTDLNSEVVEGECEEYWREIYKIQKQFNTIIKKRKLELQTRLGEKKKSKSKL